MATAMIVCLVASTVGPTGQSQLEEMQSLYTRAPQHVTVKHYSPGIMEHTLQVRLRQGYKIPSGVDGYVSRPECSTIGQVLYLRIAGYRKVFRLAQIDCSQYVDKARHMRENIVEVGYTIAKQSGLVRDGYRTGTLWGR